MRNRRLFLSGYVYFITFRTEEGLPFVPLRFMNMLIQSALARAQALYPVQLIAFTVEPNHVHMLIRVIDPEATSRFIGYFKAESANYLNRLLGRRQRTVWAERFDSPAVLDLDKALEIFAYVTLNPVKDGLVHSMHEYPGVSSNQYLLQGTREIEVKSIPRDQVPQLCDPTKPFKDDASLSRFFGSDEFSTITLKIEPEALKAAFPDLPATSDEECRKILLSTLTKAEEKFQTERGESQPVGRERLIKASILQPHTPPTTGRKMICVSSIRSLRQRFISFFKDLRHRCQIIYERWKRGHTDEPFPFGMFPPPRPRKANLLPALV